jgi:aminoglycoside phosphotransferase (APT) family kinase protein
MYELSEANAVDYLHRAGFLDPQIPAQAKTLAWGVSNVVLRISPESGPDFVVKQSREKLRTQADWFSRLDRIWREIDIMQTLAPRLPPGVIPNVLFEDRENYLFGMEAVAADHVVWKEELLAGRADSAIASTLGMYLATIHGQTAGDDRCRQMFGDRQVFDELRIDPFYRRIADVHPALRPAIAALIDETFATSICLVHADFSPKNVLLTRQQAAVAGAGLNAALHCAARRITLVDFETGHFGDPAFDLGFFLSHLLLKTVRYVEQRAAFLGLARSFWEHYRQALERIAIGRTPGAALLPASDLDHRAIGHLAGCLLSRIDGKSTIDYLTRPGEHDFVRRFSSEMLHDPPCSLEDVFHHFDKSLASR